MAEYKTADKLPILEEVTESTYALVEDNGALKRVSGESLGGKSNCCVISIDYGAVSEPSEASSSSPEYTCNMTYDELMEALGNKTLDGLNIIVYAGVQMQLGTVRMAYFGPNAPGIMIEWYVDGSDGGFLCFASDNTISEFNMDS